MVRHQGIGQRCYVVCVSNVFISGCFYIFVGCIVSGVLPNVLGIAQVLTLFKVNWFITAYLILYSFAPVLNGFAGNVGRRQLAIGRFYFWIYVVSTVCSGGLCGLFLMYGKPNMAYKMQFYNNPMIIVGAGALLLAFTRIRMPYNKGVKPDRQVDFCRVFAPS